MQEIEPTEPKKKIKYPYWQQRINDEFILQPGKHLLTQGLTGSGKTNLLKWLLKGFLNSRSIMPASEWECLVWFDRGKSSEILQLCQLFPVRLLIPEGCDMEITFSNEDEYFDIEKVFFSDPKEIWQKLDRDRLNIVCIQMFLIDPSRFSPVVAKIFKSLVMESFKYNIHPENCPKNIMLPRITIFIDEVHNLAPSKGQGSGSREEAVAGAWLQANIELLRSQNIRLVGSTHGWRKIRPGIRSSFNIHVAMPGAYYPSNEKPKISRYNVLFEKLETHQAIFIFETDTFSNPIKVPWMGKGSDLGYIIYSGQMGQQKKDPEEKEETISRDAIKRALIALSALTEQT